MGVQSPQRLDQTETGFLVVGKHMTRNSAALHGSKPYRLRFRNQIANCQNEAVRTDQDTTARAFGAESPGAERVLRDHRPQAQNGTQRTVKIERAIPGLRLSPRISQSTVRDIFEDSSGGNWSDHKPSESAPCPLSCPNPSQRRPLQLRTSCCPGALLDKVDDRFM